MNPNPEVRTIKVQLARTRQNERYWLRKIAEFGTNQVLKGYPRSQRRLSARAYANAAYLKYYGFYAPDHHKYEKFTINPDFVQWILKEFDDFKAKIADMNRSTIIDPKTNEGYVEKAAERNVQQSAIIDPATGEGYKNA